MSEKINGQCLCGAIKVTATTTNPIVRACHCDMCRQHTSSMFMSLATDSGSETIEGPAKSFRSSDWAERGFCEVCGSTLWYGTLHDNAKHLAAGLFENAADAPLKMEFFVDKCPQGYALSGDHKRLTAEQTIALFAPEEES
ncbi:GFA family protein [Sulfitobacter sp. MF3-043]|uniref:GFA family protein n=1 Tax=Sulfitobacter sediminivivens TaxID=3252902 RepID=UPI0036DB21AA